MVKIVKRHPQRLQRRWRNLVVTILETTNRYPSIADSVCFVSDAAREVTDPVFGVLGNKSSLKEAEELQFWSKLLGQFPLSSPAPITMLIFTVSEVKSSSSIARMFQHCLRGRGDAKKASQKEHALLIKR